jgi:hypothetical protein
LYIARQEVFSMPLRDHFSEDVTQLFRWESFHSQWAGTMVRHLNRRLLPPAYHAAPRVRLGTLVEIDGGAFVQHSQPSPDAPTGSEGSVGVYSPPQPAMTLEADLSQDDLFEIQVFDDKRGDLVAAIELISPGNKDRPQSRHDFVVKCASMLKAQVSLVLIDVVTDRQANLFKELLEYLEIRRLYHPLQGPLYCCSLLPRGSNGHAKVEVWPEVLQVGAELPNLPLWLRDDLAVPLDLESTYEETCGDLRA